MTDDALIEAMAREALKAFALASGLGIFPDDEQDEDWREDLVNGMKAALAVARPVIRAQALEEAARVADNDGTNDGDHIATVIRALKEKSST